MYTLRSLRYNGNYSVNSIPEFYNLFSVWFTVNSHRHIWVQCRSSTVVVRITHVHPGIQRILVKYVDSQVSVLGMYSEKTLALYGASKKKDKQTLKTKTDNNKNNNIAKHQKLPLRNKEEKE